MTSKTLTREDVIREACVQIFNRTDENHDKAKEIAAYIADALGLVAPKPFERVAWARVWDDGSYIIVGNETDARSGGGTPPNWRAVPILIQEISPDDPRLAKKERGEGE